MIKINNEIIATAEQNIVITQANYDKLTTAEKNNPLKTYFISDSSIAAQNLVSSEPAVQPMSLDDDAVASIDDSDGTTTNGSGTEYLVADKDGVVTGPMGDQAASSTDFVDTDLIGLNIADVIGNASMLASYGGDGTIIGAIADLYKRLGVEPTTSDADAYDAPVTYSDYLGLIGDRSTLDQYNMPNITTALMDLFDRIADAENKAEIARVNAEDAMKAQAEAEAAKAAAEKAQKEAEESKAETEKDLANANNRADNAEASASDAWKQLHDTTEELNAEKAKNEHLQSELDAAKKSEENKAETTEPGESTDTETPAPGESTDTTGSGETTDNTESGETTDTDKGDTTPPESTDETTGSTENKSTSESESTDTVTGKPDASTETTAPSESTEASGTTDQSSETTESPEETTTENKSEETVETPSTESTEEPSVKEEAPSETTTPATEDSVPASSDEEK
nr:MAG TPA: hypothetical protein [Caudoviricetes sp.]